MFIFGCSLGEVDKERARSRPLCIFNVVPKHKKKEHDQTASTARTCSDWQDDLHDVIGEGSTAHLRATNPSLFSACRRVKVPACKFPRRSQLGENLVWSHAKICALGSKQSWPKSPACWDNERRYCSWVSWGWKNQSNLQVQSKSKMHQNTVSSLWSHMDTYRHNHAKQARPRAAAFSFLRRRVGLLGCGAFGAVELVEHTGLGDTYALKAQPGSFKKFHENPMIVSTILA